MAGDERDAAGQLALGDGDAGVGGRGDAGGDAGDDLERDAGLAQQLRLLAAAAEHERVAALEAHDAPARAGVLEQERVRGLLRDLRARALLADVDELGVRARVRERLGRDQAVVEDHVGLRDQLDGADGQQAGVAGAGADEVDDPAHAASSSARRSTSPAPASCMRRGELAAGRLGVAPGGGVVLVEHPLRAVGQAREAAHRNDSATSCAETPTGA